MLVQLLSDLHLEHQPFTFKRADGVDVLILAGDIAAPLAHGRLVRLFKSLGDLPTVVVMGNHDRYTDHFDAPLFRSVVARFPSVHLLDNSHVDIEGVRFCGGTLWSDFNLEHDPLRDGIRAQRGISDFTEIIVGDDACGYRHVHPIDMVADWAKCREAIQTSKPDVIVTHFLPSARSISQQFIGSPLNPYFASNCEDVLNGARLAIHGHTHSSADYMLNGTRVVCNPRGYPSERNGFNSLLTVEV